MLLVLPVIFKTIMKGHDQTLVLSVRNQLQGGGGGGGIPFSSVNVHVKTSILFSIRGESTTENDYKPLNQPWIHLKDPLK